MPRRGGRQSLGDISLQLRIQLWDAIHHNRTLYGKKCSSIRSFFNAVDAARKGSVGRKALGAAMGRLDVGLSEAQVERLLRSMDSDNSGAVDFGAPRSPLPPSPARARSHRAPVRSRVCLVDARRGDVGRDGGDRRRSELRG